MIILSNISEYAVRELKASSVEWEEDKHPREQNGRFAPKGTASSNSTIATSTNQKPHNSTIHHESNHKQRSSISELKETVSDKNNWIPKEKWKHGVSIESLQRRLKNDGWDLYYNEAGKLIKINPEKDYWDSAAQYIIRDDGHGTIYGSNEIYAKRDDETYKIDVIASYDFSDKNDWTRMDVENVSISKENGEDKQYINIKTLLMK